MYSSLAVWLSDVAADTDGEFEASVLSDSLLDRKPRKRAMNLALGLDELYKGGTKRLKVSEGARQLTLGA